MARQDRPTSFCMDAGGDGQAVERLLVVVEAGAGGEDFAPSIASGLIDPEQAVPLGRHIGFGLVVVVVRDEVLDRVLWEERLEFAVELGRERFIVRQHQGRALHLLDHVGGL